jgi:hypothetical protein
MAKGNAIVLTVEAKGNRVEGIAAEAILPGTMIAIDAAVEPVGGRHSFNAETTAGFAIADIDYLQGKTNTDSTAIGERVFGYCPLPGDELNVLFVASDGAQAIGDIVGPVGTAGLFAATGTGWVIMETITVGASPAAGTLVHVMKL